MTDSYAATSELAPSSDFAPVGLDVSRIDRNLRRVSELEFATTLPPLPDLVKMDLIQQDGADEDSITELLLGLDDRLNSRGDDEQTMPGEATMAPQLPRPQQTGLDQTRIILAAMTSNPAPKAVSADAAKMFKLRAIERGMLDMEPSRVDNSWSPEFNRIRGEMAFDDYNRSQRGDRFGAIPLDHTMGILDQFTSPAGLLHMATELDLFWDFGQIGDEISSWGDKFRAWADADNPLDWARKGIDALTGPIDDIVFPIVNVGLMFVGAGAVVNSARVGWQGARLAEGATLFSRLWQGGRLGRFADSLPGIGRFAEALAGGARANLAELGRASMVSSRLSRSGIGALSTAGDLLADWRALRPVIAGKQVVQQGMRLGFVAAAEKHFPGYQSDGLSLDDAGAFDRAGWALYDAQAALGRNIVGAVGGGLPGIVGAGVAMTGLELMFAPYNIFSPGTFFRHGVQGAGTVSSLARGAVGRLGSTPGRAVAGAAVGALAGTIVGDDAGDIAKGAAIGAAGAGALPVLGRALEIERVHQGLAGALLGAGAGALLGDNPEDIALGALAGIGVQAIPNNVRRRIYNQAGLNGLDQLLRGVGHAMVRSSFLPIARDQEIMVGAYQGIRRTLLHDTERLAQWEMDVRSLGVVGALAKMKYAGDVEMAAAELTFAYSSFATDWISSAQAAAVKGGFDEVKLARNKIVNQLRPIDIGRPAEDIIADVAKAQAVQEAGGVGGNLEKIYARRDELIEQYTLHPEQAVNVAEQHNKLAGDTILQLFDQRNFPDPMATPAMSGGPSNLLGNEWAGQSMRSRRDLFADHLAGYFDSAGDYSKFTASTDSIRQARAAGLFDDAVLVPVTTRRGKQVDPYRRGGRKVDPAVTKANAAVGDLVANGTVDPAKVPGVDVVGSANEIGRVTVMRADELSSQDWDNWAEQVADVVDTMRVVREMQSRNWQAALDMVALDDAFTVARLGGEVLTNDQIVEMAKQAARKGVNRNSMKKLLNFARHHKVPVSSLDTTLRKMGEDLAKRVDVVAENGGLGRLVFDEQGRRLSGVDSLERRLAQLRKKVNETAKEIDLDEMIRRAGADDVRGAVDYSYLDAARSRTRDFEGNPSLGELLGARGAGDALDEFDALPDDALITVYHGTTRENADALLRSGKVDPAKAGSSTGDPLAAAATGDMYVAPTYETAREYGDVVVALTVRKGDMSPSIERATAAIGGSGSMSLGDAFFDTVAEGAVVRGWGDAKVVTAGGPRHVAGAGAPNAQVQHLLDLKAGMGKRDYKLVHGTEFLMPEDLSFNVPTFNDVTRRHMNAVSIGNWFGRRHPVEVQILDDRRRRLAIVKQLSKVGKDLKPEDEEVGHILETMEDWLRREQEEVANSLNRSHHRGVVTKTADRIKSSFTPVRLDDVGGISKNRTAILAELDKLVDVKGTPLLTPDEAMAVYRATNEFRNTDFKDMGLYAIESYLRGKNAPASFLKALGGSKYGGNVTGRIARQAVTGAAIGGIAGAATAGDVSFEERLKATLTGGGLGAVAGATLAGGVNALDASKDIIQKTEDFRYGYLADGYARLRDSMRFTLSPFFDLSRYTEGLMLAQTAVPLRKANGERIIVPLNMSPRGLRKRIAKQLIEESKEVKPLADVPMPSGLEKVLREPAHKARYDELIRLADNEPPVAPGMVRLWRGDPTGPATPLRTADEIRAGRAASAAEAGRIDWRSSHPEMMARDEVQGRWFTHDRDLAATYPTNRDPDELNVLSYVDIPKEEYEKIRGLADQAEDVRGVSMMPASEAVVPRELMGGVKRLDPETMRPPAAGKPLTEVEARRVAQNRYDRNVAEFNGAAKSTGDFDVDAIDSAGQWFRQVGILGFSPTDWMATAFAHLRTEGLSVEDAYREARGMYQYGTRGRSAAELSVNFIMFPFSFQKKALGHIGKWMNDDLGRSIIIHDALKTYEILDEKYNLDELWKDHIPFLQQLGRLNLFAYGISPGVLGGINSRLLQVVGKSVINSPALQAFLPAGFNIRDSSVAEELIGTKEQHDEGRIGGLAGQLLPVWNDINWMIHDGREIAYPVARGAFTPMAAESADAQVRDGYNEWNAYKRDFETFLADKGYTMADVRNPDWGLDDLRLQYEAKMLEIQQKYPAWWDSRLETPGNVQALEMERKNRIAKVEFGPSIGITPSPDDLNVYEMQQFIDDQMEMLELMTGETDLAFAQDAGIWDEVHRKAVELAEINPGFVALYNKFWRWQWGPIDIGMELYG